MSAPRTISIDFTQGELAVTISALKHLIETIPQSLEYEFRDKSSNRLLVKGKTLDLIVKLKGFYDALESH